MRSRKSVAIMLAFTMMLTSVVSYEFGNRSDSSDAKAKSDVSLDANSDSVESSLADAAGMALKDKSANLGTAENPFTVLEVVPYKGMGLLGYTVPGQEPVDISQFTTKQKALEFATGDSGMLSFSDTLKKKSELEDIDDPDKWDMSEITQSGYFEKKSKAGKGDYVLSITQDDVNYVPVYDFVNGTGSKASTVADNAAADEADFSNASASQKNDTAFYKNMIFKKFGSSKYKIIEDSFGTKEVIFKYNASPSANAVTYDAYAIQSMTDYYEELQANYEDGDMMCYEPSYAYDTTTHTYRYDPDAENRFYVIFIKNNEGKGKYTVSKIRDINDTAGSAQCINVADCYFDMDNTAYENLENDTNRYNVSPTFEKEVLTDDDDNITEITSGNFDVTFIYDESTTGVKRYKPVASNKINKYFENLKEKNTDSNISYEPTYIRHGGKYIALSDRSDTSGGVYVLFEEDPDGKYIIGDSHEVVAGDGSVAYAASMYEKTFGVSKSTTGRYKAEVVNGTFLLDDKKGNYDFVEDTVPASVKTDYLASKVWVKNYKFHYYTQGGYSNNNWFAKKILGLGGTDAKNYKIEVKTVTTSELNDDNSLIDDADLVYISDNFSDESTLERVAMWETYGKDTSGNKNTAKINELGVAQWSNTAASEEFFNFYEKDLNWDTTLKLFRRAAGLKNNFVPVVIDSTIYTETLKGHSGRYDFEWNNKIKNVDAPVNPYTNGTGSYAAGNCNVLKLYIMLYTKESPLTFYNEYLAALDSESGSYTFIVDASNSSDKWNWSTCYIHYWNDSQSKKGDIQLQPIGDYKYQGTISKSLFNDNKMNVIVMNSTTYNRQTNTINNLTPGRYTIKLTSNAGGNVVNSNITQGTDNDIDSGTYKALSGNAAKYWNELTFLPSNLDSFTKESLRNLYVDENLIDILVSGNADNRVSKWPTINTKKNIFSFDATKVNNKYSNLEGALPSSADAYITDAKNGVLELKGSLDNSSRPSWIEVIYYIIKYNDKDKFDVEINNKDVLNVLEIEPCKDFSVSEYQVRSWLPEYTGGINVTSWISTEYIGKINDVNEDFDIIYIGMNDSLLRLTGFSDSSLNNKRYVHVGDTTGTKQFNGHDWIVYNIAGDKLDGTGPVSFKINANQYRFSGNDITSLKLKQLNNYVKGGYAVVLADELYDKDTTTIDTSTNIYQFAENNVGSDNVFKNSSLLASSNPSGYVAQREKFQQYAGHPKVSLDISASNEDIIESSKADTYYESDIRNLDFNYSIIDPYAKSSDKYTVTLYADTNGDGTYSDIEAIAIDTGRKASQYANATYNISRELTEDFMGILHWALVVKKQGSDSDAQRTNTVEGYLLIKNPKPGEREEINVLQINHSRDQKEQGADGGWYSGGGRSTTFSLSSNSTFRSYINDNKVTDFYDVKVKEITTSDFMKWYDPGQGGEKYVTGDDSTDKLKDYDMIVYGFADAISDIKNDYGAFDNIMAFIDEGKAFLATHDTTSMYNYSGLPLSQRGIENNGYICGVDSNQFLRDRVGMNRYNIPTLYKLERGIYDANESGYDVAYVPNTNQSNKYEIHDGVNVGWTDFLLLQAGNNCTNKLMYKANNKGYDNASVYSSNVNQGQVTRFPYHIDDTIKTGRTHGQYYQLNLDDPNIVVWYCLAGTDEKGYIYDISRNDARNYYYIYSYKNIFYTGVGHNNVSESMEIQLFVNTMIAAFRASTKAPELIVNNEESSYVDPDSNINQSILYYYTDLGSDEENSDYNFGSELYDVRITPIDRNLISDKIRLNFYDQNGNDITDSTDVYLVGDDGDASTKAEHAGGSIQVRSNYAYIYKFPMKYLQHSADGTYTITTVIKNASDAESTKQITIGKRTLFELK